MMRQRTKKWSLLTVSVLLALSSLSLPQTVWAATALSGTEANTNNASAGGSEGSATAVGDGAKAKADRAVAIGAGASAAGLGSISIGYNAITQNGQSLLTTRAIAIGMEAEATSTFANALGYQASATGLGGEAMGYQATASGSQSVAIGCTAEASAEGTIAIGGQYSDSSTVESATASGKYALALGYGAQATSEAATAIGKRASVSAASGLAIGESATASHANSVALGASSATTETNSVSVGSSTQTRSITNVTKGDSANDVAIWDQIAAENQTLNLDADTTHMVNEKSIQGNQLATNDGTVLATFTKMAKVANDDYGFVSGVDLYNETRDGITVANYISQSSSTGVNLNALAEAIGAKTSVTGLYADTDSVEAQMEKVGKKTIRSMSDAISNAATDAQRITVTRYDGSEETIEIAGQGSIASGDKRLVDGGTVYSYVDGIQMGISADVSELKTDITTIQMNSKTEGGSYVKAGEKVGENLKGLDDAIGAVDKDYTFLKKSVNDDGNFSMALNLIRLDTGITKLISYDEEKETLRIGAGIGRAAETVSFGSDIETPRRLTDISAGISNTDAANVGQLIQGGTYSAVSKGIGSSQAVTLGSNDGNTKISISIAGEGTIAKGDQRLVNGDTVYQYVNDIQSGLSADLSGLQTDVASIQADITAKDGSYVDAGTKVGENLKALDDAIGTVKEKGNVIEKSLDENGNLKTSVAANLEKIDDKLGSLDSSKNPDSNAIGDKYSFISSRNTISKNLERLDENLAKVTSDASADLTEINRRIRYENATAGGENAIALGEGSSAGGSHSISFGTGAAASEEDALVFGRGAKASAKRALAFGNSAAATAENALAIGNGASASGSGSVAIGSGSVATEANVVSIGSEGNERRLTHLSAGVNDTDAVNVAQMNAAVQLNFDNVRHSLTHEINKVAAGSAALAALHPEAYDPDDKLSFAVGFGHYRSANAGAIGAFYKPNAVTTISAGATIGEGDSLMNLGVSFKLGRGAKDGACYRSSAAVSAELAALRRSNDRLAADNKLLKEDNAAQATAIKEQAKEIEGLKADNERMKEQIAIILSRMELSDHVERTMVK